MNIRRVRRFGTCMLLRYSRSFSKSLHFKSRRALWTWPGLGDGLRPIVHSVFLAFTFFVAMSFVSGGMLCPLCYGTRCFVGRFVP